MMCAPHAGVPDATSVGNKSLDSVFICFIFFAEQLLGVRLL